MWRLVLFFVLPVLFHLTIASSAVSYACNQPAQPRPLVLWHGMGLLQALCLYYPLTHYPLFNTGDSHSSSGMLKFISMIKDVHPAIFVHSIYIEEDLSADQRAGFVGNMLARPSDQLTCNNSSEM